MPKGSSPREVMKAKASMLNRKLLQMSRSVPVERSTAGKGASLMRRGIVKLYNQSLDVAEALQRANPNYKKIESQLEKIEQGLEKNSEKLNKM